MSHEEIMRIIKPLIWLAALAGITTLGGSVFCLWWMLANLKFN